MGEVTILHTRESREFACEMAAALAVDGHSVFRRDAAAPAGDPPRADAVIVVWSPGAVSNSSTVEAARRALARRILVPVSIGDVSPPSSFAHLWPIDLVGWRGDRADPRWQFVRDEISLAMRRNEFAPRAPADARRSGTRRLFRAGTAALIAIGVLGIAAAIVFFAAPQPRLGLRAGAPAEAAAVPPAPAGGPERPVYSNVSSDANDFGTATPEDEEVHMEEAASNTGGIDNDSAALISPSPSVAVSDVASSDETDNSNSTATAAPANDERPGLDVNVGTNSGSEQTNEAPAASDAVEIANPDSREDSAATEAAPSLPPAPVDDFTGAVYRDCTNCPDMAEIEPGPAIAANGVETIGSLSFAAPFAMSRREVTFDQWEACVRGGGCRAYSPPDAGWGKGKRPVINVSFADAQSYVDWLSKETGRRYRLPTAAEWAYAAHAGRPGEYAFGEPSPQKANYDGGVGARRQKTAPAGSFSSSVYGLYDMNGNVAEWVDDCANSPARDGAACAERIVMGGGWDSPPSAITADSRMTRPGSTRAPDIGFRVARDAP